jgi:hypothetical protein
VSLNSLAQFLELLAVWRPRRPVRFGTFPARSVELARLDIDLTKIFSNDHNFMNRKVI